MWLRGLYLAISKVSTFPYPSNLNNGFSVIEFSPMMKKGFRNKSLPREISKQDISQNKSAEQSFKKVFHQQILKRNLHEKRSLKRNLYQIKFNNNLYHKRFDNSIFAKAMERETPTKEYLTKTLHQTKSPW